MNHQVILYDQNINLAMLLTVLMTGYTFVQVSNLSEFKQNIHQNIALILIVEDDHTHTMLEMFEDYKIRYPSLKVMFLAKKDKYLKTWKQLSDCILSDWFLGDKRIMQSIEKLLN